MSYLRDAIMESNSLEEEIRFHNIKNPPQLKSKSTMKEGIVTDIVDKVGNAANKVSQVCDVLTEEENIGGAMVDIENYLNKDNYVESLQMNEEKRIELPDRPMKGRPGSPEYDANDNRRKRVAMYRKYANIDEDFEITEGNINKRAFDKTCVMQNCPKEKLMAELLKKPYTGLERYEED